MPKFDLLPIDKIMLDTSNPRIARLIEKYGPNPSADQINLALGAGDPSSPEGGTTFISLKASIKTNGGIINPIIVNKMPDGTLLAIEGNTRVAIYREFKKQKVHGDWSTIPAMIYDNLDKARVDSIRLQAHLVGPRPWDPYSKAKYLNYLSNCEHLSITQIIDYCGGKKKEVSDYIDAYNEMETYYRAILDDPADFDSRRFSAFVELQNPRVRDAIAQAGFNQTEFSRWVNDKLIDPLSTVRDLPRILGNKESKTIFLKEGAKEALKVLIRTEDNDLSTVTIDRLVNELLSKLGNIQFSTIKDYCENMEGEKTRNLYDLLDELKQTCDWITKGSQA